MPKSIDNSTNNLTTGEAKILALLIGVNQYQDANIYNLKYCANDCEKLAAALETSTKLFPNKTIQFHRDDTENPPYLKTVRDSLDGLIAAAGKLDTIIIYFSGHGILEPDTKQPVLCLTDTQKNNLIKTGLPVTELLEKLAASEAKYQLLFLDACHSGGLTFQQFVTQKKGTEEITVPPINPTPELIDILQRRASKSKGFYALLSCDKNQESLEFPQLRHGLFTYYLIRGFLGEAADEQGVIEADALYKYVYHRTLEYIDKTNQQIKLINQQKRGRGEDEQKPFSWQTPRRIVEGAGEFVLGLTGRRGSGECLRRSLFINSLPDCEETVTLAGIFSSRGGFEVDYFPGRDRSWEDAKEAIARCLRCDESQRPSLADVTTAFLYFRAAIETSPEGESFLLLGDGVRLSRSFLRKLLRNSKTDRIAIAFDCPETSPEAMAEWVEDLKLEGDRSLCLLAAPPNSKNSTEFAAALVRVLAEASPGFTVAEAIAKLQQISHSPLSWLSGAAIELLLPAGEKGAVFDSGICPYMGLQAFGKKDAFYFHGRETLAREILARLQATSFLAVVGASGSGKSSVVRAGVLPKLEAGKLLPQKCATVCLRPGREPIRALALALAGSPGEAKEVEGLLHLGVESLVLRLRQREEGMLVLVVDQFEELFAVAGELERQEFLGLLLGALKRLPDRLKAVVTLREDFISACLEVPELAELVRESHVLVAPSLTEEEYREAIVEPARKVGLTVEEGLVEVLLEEVREAGLALPLLQFALRQLWECRRTATLSLQVYQESVGGFKGLLERRADEVLGELGEEERECARWVFLSLVHLGEGREDTRRRVLRSELLVDKYDEEVVMGVLRRLSEGRLIVVGAELESRLTPLGKGGTGEGKSSLEKGETGYLKAPLPKGGLGGLEVSVEIAHEILIRHWSTLQWWLEENRSRLQLQRQAEREAKKWLQEGRSPDFLPRGAALREAEELYGKYADELSPLTREFVEEAMRLEKREEMARRRQRRRTISGLVGGLVAVSLFAAGAVWQWRRAVVGEKNAEITARIATLESLVDITLERQLDVLAVGKELQAYWVNLENRVRGTVLLQRTFNFEQWKERNTLEGHQDRVNHLSFSPDGSLIASASSDGTVRLWKPDGTPVATLEGHQDYVTQVSFSPDGNLIASASDNTVQLWKPDGTPVATLEGHQRDVKQISFSPDSNLIASLSYDNKVRLWKSDGTALVTLEEYQKPFNQLSSTLHSNLMKLKQGGVNYVTFSPDSLVIASANNDKTVHLWKSDGTLVVTLEGHQDWVNHVSFSPDGNLIASASNDNTVRLWKPDGSAVAILEGHQDSVSHVSFSPDGSLIASASGDGVRLWKSDGTAVAILQGHQGWIRHVSFSPDGNLIASADGNTVRLWKADGTPVATLEGHQGWVRHVSFSPDSNLIASASDDNTVRLWKQESTVVATLKEHQSYVNYLSFSPDGNLIASANGNLIAREIRPGSIWKPDRTLVAADGNLIARESSDNSVRLWKRDGTLVAVLEGHQDRVNHISFSPDGSLIASASQDKTVRLWKPDGTLVAILEGHQNWPNRVSFSPDGNLIASADSDGLVHLYTKNATFIATLKTPLDNESIVTFRQPLKNDLKTKISLDASDIVTAIICTINWSKSDNTLLHIFKTPPKYENVDIFKTLPKYDNKVNFSIKTSLKYKKTTIFQIFSHSENINIFQSFSSCNFSLNINTKDIIPRAGIRVVNTYFSFSPDGNLIASASSNNTVQLWKPDGTTVAILQGHQDRVSHFSFSPDGNLIASASSDDTVRLWKSDGTAVAILQGHQDRVSHVSFSPDGKLIASASADETVRLWKSDGTAVATLKGHQKAVSQVSFSPDGNLITSASYDNTVRLWKADGTPVATLKGHQDYVTQVSFSPDGNLMATASNDSTVRLWNLDRDSLLKQACDWVRDYLTNNPNVSEEQKRLCN